MELNQERIEELVVREASDRLISDDAIYERVKRDIDTRVDKIFSSRVEAQITAAIDEAIKSGFDKPYQKYDGFGRPKGEPTTISEQLSKRIDGYWTEKVDSQGRLTDSNYNATTRAEYLLTKICAEDLHKSMKEHAVTVTGELKDGLRRHLHETVNRLLSELFHVRSLDDQGKRRQDSSSIHPEAKDRHAG